jgi:hypothetical protein
VQSSSPQMLSACTHKPTKLFTMNTVSLHTQTHKALHHKHRQPAHTNPQTSLHHCHFLLALSNYLWALINEHKRNPFIISIVHFIHLAPTIHCHCLFWIVSTTVCESSYTCTQSSACFYEECYANFI